MKYYMVMIPDDKVVSFAIAMHDIPGAHIMETIKDRGVDKGLVPQDYDFIKETITNYVETRTIKE